MTATPAPRPQSPLGVSPRDAAARTTLDRVTAGPVPAGWRTRSKATFNSAV